MVTAASLCLWCASYCQHDLCFELGFVTSWYLYLKPFDDLEKVKPCYQSRLKNTLTQEQIVAGKELIEYLNKSYSKKLKVFNHGELYPTMCPVINLKEILTNV